MQEHKKSGYCIKPVGIDTLWVALRSFQLREEVQSWQNPGVRKVDLRPDSPLVILFPPWRFRLQRRVIIQIIGVAEMNADTILKLLSGLVSGDPLELAVYRVDCTVDVVGHSVDDFRSSITVARKRQSCEFADYSSGNSQKRRYETLTFGSRNRDQIKLYDKETELRKVHKVTGPLPSPWTRLERTYMKSGVPKKLANVGLLLMNGPSFDPFFGITVNSFLNVNHEALFGVKGFKLNQRQNAAWTLHLIERYGMTEARKLINAEKRDANRYMALVHEMAATFSTPLPSAPELAIGFRRAFCAQLFPDD